jgi:hypothetical protein
MFDEIEQGLDGHAFATESVDMRLLAALLHIRFCQRSIGIGVFAKRLDRRIAEATEKPSHAGISMSRITT